jgi:hypothetical protein
LAKWQDDKMASRQNEQATKNGFILQVATTTNIYQKLFRLTPFLISRTNVVKLFHFTT